ncbi:hypothetical protein JCM10213_002686 [Rhodosporidiobolus nylandii]
MPPVLSHPPQTPRERLGSPFRERSGKDDLPSLFSHLQVEQPKARHLPRLSMIPPACCPLARQTVDAPGTVLTSNLQLFFAAEDVQAWAERATHWVEWKSGVAFMSPPCFNPAALARGVVELLEELKRNTVGERGTTTDVLPLPVPSFVIARSAATFLRRDVDESSPTMFESARTRQHELAKVRRMKAKIWRLEHEVDQLNVFAERQYADGVAQGGADMANAVDGLLRLCDEVVSEYNIRDTEPDAPELFEDLPVRIREEMAKAVAAIRERAEGSNL